MIKNLSDLLAPHIGQKKRIKDVKYSKLTQPGDNYGSVMLKVDVILVNTNNNKEEILYLVAKTLPETDFYREVFRVQTTYTNEMAFYDIIVPTLAQFQKELGIHNNMDFYAKCYGQRKSLVKGSEKIDDDAVLLLENLAIKGYVNTDRITGFNLDTAKLVLKDAANFHASFLALKIKKPDIFESIVKKYCKNYELTGSEWPKIVRKYFLKVIKGREACEKLKDKVSFWGTGNILRSTPKEPFGTVIHADMWTNNIMQKYVNGRAISNKFVDFQIFTYGSPAADVFFFIWSSVQNQVCQHHLDDILQFYHKEFVSVLENHQCDSTPFSYKNFLEQIRLEAGYEFAHAISFHFLTGLSKDAYSNTETDNEIEIKVQKASKDFKEKTYFMVEECEKRGWLY